MDGETIDNTYARKMPVTPDDIKSNSQEVFEVVDCGDGEDKKTYEMRQDTMGNTIRCHRYYESMANVASRSTATYLAKDNGDPSSVCSVCNSCNDVPSMA